MTILAWFPLIAALMVQQPAPTAASQPSVDYEFFKARIQPIFTTKRPGNARCVSCHSTGTPMRLQAASAGQHHMERGRLAQEFRHRPGKSGSR